MESGVGAQMPQYQCHKKVWALKIKEIKHVGLPEFTGALCRGCVALGSACGSCERCKWYAAGNRNKILVVPEEAGFSPIEVGPDFVLKHEPVAGGYYVVYDNDYRSFSPAKAFEEGYAPIKERFHGQAIGWAIKQMVGNRYKVRRAGWNGKGMWLSHVPADQWGMDSRGAYDTGHCESRLLPWIGMRTADGAFVPWLASQTDLLATDWEIAE